MTNVDDDSVTPRSPNGGVNLLRAGVVIVLFLVGLVLLLGKAGQVVATAPPTTHHPGRPGPVNKAATKVQVANASSTHLAAATVSQQLKLLGWNVLPAETAATQRGHWLVYYAPGFQRAARLVAVTVGVPHQHVFLRPARTGVAGEPRRRHRRHRREPEVNVR